MGVEEYMLRVDLGVRQPMSTSQLTSHVPVSCEVRMLEDPVLHRWGFNQKLPRRGTNQLAIANAAVFQVIEWNVIKL